MKNARQIKDNQFLIDLSFNTSNFYGVTKVQKSKIIYDEILKKRKKKKNKKKKKLKEHIHIFYPLIQTKTWSKLIEIAYMPEVTSKKISSFYGNIQKGFVTACY